MSSWSTTGSPDAVAGLATNRSKPAGHTDPPPVVTDLAMLHAQPSPLADRLIAEAHQLLRALAERAGDIVASQALDHLATERCDDWFLLNPYLLTVPPGRHSRDWSDLTNQRHVAELAGSIARHGVQHPLLVRWDHPARTAWVVDGECRLLASLRAILVHAAPLVTVPVQVTDAATPIEALVLAHSSDYQAKPRSGLETAGLYHRLHAHGYSLRQIAERCGQSTVYVSELLAVYRAPVELHALIRQGWISLSFARRVLRQEHYDHAAALVTLNHAVTLAGQRGERHASGKHLRRQPEPMPRSHASSATDAACWPDERTALRAAFSGVAVHQHGDAVTLSGLTGDTWQCVVDILGLEARPRVMPAAPGEIALIGAGLGADGGAE